MELTDGQRYGAIFGGAFVVAGLVLATVVFPFWNLIRDDVTEQVVILSNEDGVCFAETSDDIPKTIEGCEAAPGDAVVVRFGEGLAWATVVGPAPAEAGPGEAAAPDGPGAAAPAGAP